MLVRQGAELVHQDGLNPPRPGGRGAGHAVWWSGKDKLPQPLLRRVAETAMAKKSIESVGETNVYMQRGEIQTRVELPVVVAVFVRRLSCKLHSGRGRSASRALYLEDEQP